MLFTTLNFAAFLVVVLVLFYALPKPARRYLLLAASLFFYMAWNVKFVALILGLITIDYFAALWIIRRHGAPRRMALLVSLFANIGLLGWFKYANFVRETFLQLAHPGITVQPLDIILPLGISFHTFQSISYVIDVYRGEQPAITSYVDYALFVAFFPQLVAGPIVRAKEFFLDYFNWRALPLDQRPPIPAEVELNKQKDAGKTPDIAVAAIPFLAKTDYESISQLIDKVSTLNFSQVTIQHGGSVISINASGVASGPLSVAPVATPTAANTPSSGAVATPAATKPAVSPAAPAAASGPSVNAPLNGTFYRSPGPGKPEFVKEGDMVEAGATVCIVEAMKLFNPIKAPYKCKIVKMLVEHGKPVKKDEPMISIQKV